MGKKKWISSLKRQRISKIHGRIVSRKVRPESSLTGKRVEREFGGEMTGDGGGSRSNHISQITSLLIIIIVHLKQTTEHVLKLSVSGEEQSENMQNFCRRRD
uniref:Uncharacterized protein n=1 Tax=Cucumis melo TaxID=3656 RepID=A0A9I9EHB6_CUCME